MSLHVADRTLPREELAAMVAFARPGWQLRAVTLMENGQGSIYRLVVDGDEGRRTCVLKTAPADPERFDIASEARVQAVVARHTGVPAPDVLAVVDAHDDLRTPYYLMEAMPGDHLPEKPAATLPAERRRRLARELGRALGQLHDIDLELDAYGGTVGYEESTALHGGSPAGDPGGVVLDDGHETWPAALRALCERNLEELADSRFDDLVPLFRAELARRFAALPAPDAPVVGLLDCHRENVLVDRASGRLTGVLDWEGAMTLSRGYSLAAVEWSFVGISGVDLPEPHPDPLLKRVLDRDALFAGYREVTTDPAAPGTGNACYRLVFLLLDMVNIDGWTTDAWSVEPAVPLSEEGSEKLAAAYRVAAEAELDRDAS